MRRARNQSQRGIVASRKQWQTREARMRVFASNAQKDRGKGTWWWREQSKAKRNTLREELLQLSR